MSSSVVEIIQHYQRSIEKCHNDEGRLLHCIKKLYKLPVKIEHLQETGIGKTVNSLRKLNGETGVAAKALVTKWKTMVAAEEETIEPVNNQMNYYNSNSNNDGGGGGDGGVGGCGSSEEDEDQIRNNNYNNKTNNNNSNSNTQNQETLKVQPAEDFVVSSTQQLEQKQQQQQQQQQQQNQHQQNERTHHKTLKEKSNSGHQKSHKESSSSSHQKSSSNHHNHHHQQQKHSQTTTTTTENKHHKNRDSSSKEQQHHRSSSGSHHHKEKEQNSNLKSTNDEKKQQNSIKERSNHKHEKDISNNSSSKSSIRDKEKHKEKNIKESDDKQYTAKSSSKHRDHQNGDRKKSKELKSHSKDKEKQHKNDHINSNNSPRPSTSNTTVTTVTTTPNDDQRKRLIAHSSESSDHTDAAGIKTSQTQLQKTKEKKSSKRKHTNDDDHDGIDSTMGANFADVLGMLNMPKKKSKKTLSTLISPQTTNDSGNGIETSSSKKSNSSSSNHKEKDNSEKSNSKLNGVKQSPPQPELLSSNFKLEPLDPSITLDLPPISTNYKPRPLNQTVMDCVFNTNNSAASKRTLTDAEAISHGISSKTMRTKIYSGIKSGQALQVPTLFDLCIRILQKNIDAIEFTGGVPFEVLRSVLERATPSQLQNFEEYNPYLMEDCDELWRHHVQRNFRTQKRQEMETWRDMFIRCQEEEASRLNRLAQNIRQSQKEMSAPVRKTQLAFVDTMVKPPRNIQRKQEIYGTKSKIVATPAARTTGLQSVTPNATKAGDARLRAMAAFSVDNAQIGASSSSSKTKKAPLMMKTLQFIRGRNKR